MTYGPMEGMDGYIACAGHAVVFVVQISCQKRRRTFENLPTTAAPLVLTRWDEVGSLGT